MVKKEKGRKERILKSIAFSEAFMFVLSSVAFVFILSLSLGGQ
jgi:hypothetical protein